MFNVSVNKRGKQEFTLEAEFSLAFTFVET